MAIYRCMLPFTAVLLLGCGAEVVSTAVTTGKLQAEQAQQTKVQLDQFKQELSAAMQATETAASAATTAAQ